MKQKTMKGWIEFKTDQENYHIRASEVAAVYHDWNDESLGMFTHIILKSGASIHVTGDDFFDLIEEAEGN